MIKFIVHECPDSDFIGTHTYYFNRLTLSPHEDSSVIFRDPDLEYKGFIFEIHKESLLVNTLPVGHFYHSNGKRIAGTKAHRPGDILDFGATKIEIVDYKKEEGPAYLPLDQRYEKASQEEIYDELFELLERELIELEGQNESS